MSDIESDDAPSEGTAPIDRRPIATRDVPVVRRFASWLASTGLSPNAISMSSMVFGAAAGALLAATSFTEGWVWRTAWVGAAIMIQMRLLANLFDGMVAIESGKRSAVGELYNEAPDRFSDVVILVGAGFASGGGPFLGFTAAILAIGVAYIRALGAASGAGQAFGGPMAKPQRMAVLTLAALYCGMTPASWQPLHSASGRSIIGLALWVVILGCIVTVIRRLRDVARFLRESSERSPS